MSSAADRFHDSIRTPPYRWRPSETDERTPVVGDRVGVWHEVWEVIEVRPYEDYDLDEPPASEYLRPFHLVLAHVQGGVATDDRDHHLSITLGGRRTRTLPVYRDPGHYPVCGPCGQPSPCRDVMAARISAQMAETATRYEDPEVCPACSKRFRGKAKLGYSFAENLVVPFGPPVNFHVRCISSAARYEQRIARADPTHKITLSCPGDVIAHSVRSYSCTAGEDCPGAHAMHSSYSICDCPEHHGQHERGCHVDRDATRV